MLIWEMGVEQLQFVSKTYRKRITLRAIAARQEPGGGFYLRHMKIISTYLRKWLPSILLMGFIFWFSSQPPSNLPNFDWADKVLKKGGHILGYAMLAWSYWYALDLRPNKRWLAWLFAILYAMTDEYHQSFVTGRYPSVWDVFVFDNLGALIALGITGNQKKQKLRISGSENSDPILLGDSER